MRKLFLIHIFIVSFEVPALLKFYFELLFKINFYTFVALANILTKRTTVTLCVVNYEL